MAVGLLSIERLNQSENKIDCAHYSFPRGEKAFRKSQGASPRLCK